MPTGVPAGSDAFSVAFAQDGDDDWARDLDSRAFFTMKLTLPSLGVPAGLLTVADKAIPSPPISLKLVLPLEGVTVVEAALTVSCFVSVEVLKSSGSV